MLLEHHSRMLSVALDSLLKDFEPREAVPYMVAKLIFNDDQQDVILNKPTRRQRVYEFLRQYRRSAIDLDALIRFLDENGQLHLSAAISMNIQPEQRALLSERDIRSRLLRESNLPGPIKNYVKRDDLIKNLGSTLIKHANCEKFWLVVHGMAGSGKSTLVANVLRDCPELLSRYYEHVIWVNDGRSSKDSLSSLCADLFVLLTDSTQITGHESMTFMRSQVKMALLDKPNALIVLDDVLLDETVRWFDELQCRILATTRNLEIFQAARSDIIEFPMSPSGFTYNNYVTFIKKSQLSNVSDDTVIKRLHNLTGGLPAMVNIMLQLARDNKERLDWLCSQLECQSLGSFKCISSYRYSTLEDALQVSFDMLAFPQKEVLSSLAAFPADEWLPVEVISLIAPVDVTDREQLIYATEEQLATLAKHSFLDERHVERNSENYHSQFEYRIHPLVANFIKRTIHRDSAFVEELRSILKIRLRDYIENGNNERIRARIESFDTSLLDLNLIDHSSSESGVFVTKSYRTGTPASRDNQLISSSGLNPINVQSENITIRNQTISSDNRMDYCGFI